MSKMYFIHGLTGSKNNFIHLQAHFPGSESFDLAGFGEADKPDASYDKEFYVQFLETKIKTRATLVGHSMGSILAKEFALAHPELVEKLFLISYPIQKDGKLLEQMIKDPMSRALIGDGRYSKLMNRIDQSTKVLAVPLSFIFWHKYYLTVRDYYRHTPASLARAAHNTVFKDNYRTLYDVKDKATLIVGERDRNVDQGLLSDFDYHIIPKMRHYFFGYEDQIATTIKQTLL